MFENISYELLMWMALFIYIPMHLLEEAVGNWPEWMARHKYTSVKLSYDHWMAGNIFFFYPLLLIGILLYHFLGTNLIFLGLGVIFWGIINYMEHLIFCFIDKKVTPGFYTSILFFIIGVITIIKIINGKDVNILMIILAIVTSIIYVVLPILLQMSIGEKYFKRYV